LILWLIAYKNFYGLFKDDCIKQKQFAVVFVFKALAVPVFYIVYKKLYGGLELFDAGKFYHDATVISGFAKKDPLAYTRLLFGFQNDSPGSYDFDNYLIHTDNWDNGRLKDYLYNDNRVVIRLHSVLDFFSFGSYFVHALLNCFLSFIGIVFLYKSLKDFFAGKEMIVLLILCFFPALWFYTGAVLKEGIAMFVLGSQVFCLKSILQGNYNYKHIICSVLLLALSVFLKPYLLLFSSLCFFIFFFIRFKSKANYKTLWFILVIGGLTVLTNFISVSTKGKSLTKAIYEHQRVFADASKGGIFLLDNEKFVRLEYNFKLANKIPGRDSVYTINQGAPYIYWENSHQQDTLYCTSNKDTLTHYKMIYVINESRSNISPEVYSNGLPNVVGYGLFYSLFYPFFYNSTGAIQLLASLENLLILMSLIISFAGL
ncbi:MAG: hypothetical protein HYZ42_11770, partial [Bacteroidetes bacterium]|nr:hypothetical protein [Bacteroidota bacterium]